MKVFEEWLKDHKWSTTRPEAAFKEVWRAALEWALKAGGSGNCGWCYTESVIEDELEED